MHTNKKAVLMISLGTPDSPGWFDVASYLSEFLGDGRIINIPSFLRYLLVNLIIVPTRSFSSSKSYKELWTERGSPLKYHMEDLTAKVQEELKDSHDVVYAMRYKNPSVKDQLKELEKKGYEEIILFPVFPQYSSAANGSGLTFGDYTGKATFTYVHSGTKLVSNKPLHATSFHGNGASLSALNASNISTGTIADARLPNSISSNISGLEY